MKWLFLINNASFLSEFFGKLAEELIKQGDDCLVVFNSKIAEYERKKFFPEKIRFISKVDWTLENYKKDRQEFGSLSWKQLFPVFDNFYFSNLSYDNSFKIVSQMYQFHEFLFEKEKPDVVISEPPAGLFHLIAYYFCNKNNRPYLGVCASRFLNRIDVYDLSHTFSEYEKSFREMNDSNLSKEEKEFAKDFVKKFISHKQLPSYVGFSKIYFSHLGLLTHFAKRIKESRPSLFRYFSERRNFKDFDYESEVILKRAIKAPWKSEKRKFKMISQKNIFDNFNKDENFFFFPLQLEAESSTSVLATYYCDQLNTVKNIAFTLPFPYKLVVKEHPASVGTRPESFYRKLKEIPNVVLVSSQENIENIIKNSAGVITLTSTAGLEAALSGKQVYVLGNVFYSYHPLCKKLENFEELKNKIEEDLTSKSEIDNLEDINNRFITSYFRNSIAGDMISASIGKDVNNYELIFQNLKKILLKQKN